MPLKYSTACEEMAYSKNAEALKRAADCVVGGPHGGWKTNPESFFEAGEVYRGHDVTWFTWHGDDNETALLFVGTEAQVRARLRKLDERKMD